MKKIALIAALPTALALAACGSSAPDGSDTADMAPDAVEPMPTGSSETPDPMMTEGMPADMDGTMADPMATATPEPMATETPM